MNIVEEHTTPDGLLRLAVARFDDGDIAIGFHGLPWHTHPSILAALSGLPEDQALRTYIDEVITGHRTIAVIRVDGKIQDAWILDDPDHIARYKKYAPPTETIELRSWDG
ncbi:MAG: hypothetical protein ACXW3Z_08335 [Limisphaerales bacterium]